MLRWTWDSPRDEAEFTAALREWEEQALPASTERVAIAREAGAVTLVLARGADRAGRVARAD